MNWYKIARRNPYEMLANKYANKFFEWFIQQDYAKHFDSSENVNKNDIGFIDLPLTTEDLDTIGMKNSFSERLYIAMEISQMHHKRKPFIIRAVAYGSSLTYPSENNMNLPVIELQIKLNKMNKNIWHQFKQKLHAVLRHEFEHINQSVKEFKTTNPSKTISFPQDQQLNEFHNMKTRLTDIQRKLRHIKNNSINNATKQMKLYCETNLNQELCEKAKQDFQYALKIEQIVDESIKYIAYFSNSIELEAFATGAYYDAKKRGINVEDGIKDMIQYALINPDYSHPEIDWLLYESKQIIIHWMLRFVENRYPEYSKQRNQQPV